MISLNIFTMLKSQLTFSDLLPFSYEKYIFLDQFDYLIAFINNDLFPPFEVELQVSGDCNLCCKWCIGRETLKNNYILNLPTLINDNNIEFIIESLRNFKINNLSVKHIKISGFTGEPFTNKSVTLKAINLLVNLGFRVGLFTNGVLMEKDTWDTLSGIDYVHISLDAGPISFWQLKELKRNYSRDTFDKILSNIEGLRQASIKRSNNKLQITVGFIITGDNYNEIYEVASLVKAVGADSMRFKADINDKYSLNKNIINDVFNQISQVRNNLVESSDCQSFNIILSHSKEDIINKTYKLRSCIQGCFFHYFQTTIGPDGRLYLCSHNAIPSALSLGDCLNDSLLAIWNSRRKKYLCEGVRFVCRSNVCPPFGNRFNSILNMIYNLKERYGVDYIIDELYVLKNHLNKIIQ